MQAEERKSPGQLTVNPPLHVLTTLPGGLLEGNAFLQVKPYQTTAKAIASSRLSL
jgi:hypothetical protein